MNSPSPAVVKDLAWIKQALQSALELEYATQPLYLAALFSLEVQNYTSYNWIRSIVMEEMVHMAIAANMLAALGGSPQVKNIRVGFPIQGLPAGVEPDLRVGLAQLSKRQLENFMRIESPAFLLPEHDRGEAEPTVASLYDDIRKAIRSNGDAVRAAVAAGGPANQVGDNIGFTTITAAPGTDVVETLCSALDEIVEQGEGSPGDSLRAGPRFEGEKSHYARFAELYYGAEYRKPDAAAVLTRETEREFFRGLAIDPPTVINTLAVPSDGYAAVLALDPNAAAVKTDLDAFDAQVSAMLAQLDAVWNGPADAAWKTLGGAVGIMVKLRVLSCFNIQRHPVPAAAVAQLAQLYPGDVDRLRTYSDVAKPVFYGPRFVNTNA